MRLPRRKGPAGPVHAVRRTGQPGPRFNYELFNCNNFNIRYWSWNYRGCWLSIRTLSLLSSLSSRDGRLDSGGMLSHGYGTYLKPPHVEAADTFARSTRAPFRDSARDQHRLCAHSFPDPGCLPAPPISLRVLD